MNRITRIFTGVFFTLAAFSVTPVLAEATPAVAPSAPAPAAPAYAGITKCKMCHLPEFKAYSAFVSDTSGTLKIHTDTSHAQNVMRPTHTDTMRSSLTCETCHGPASLHVALPMTQRDTEVRRGTINKTTAPCRTCHEVHPVTRR